MYSLNKRRQLVAPLMLAAGAALALAACGGSGGAALDGAADVATDTAGDGGAMTCDPAAQNCGAAQKCDIDCDGTTAVLACQPGSGGGAVGSACSATQLCAGGTGCLTAPDAGAACRRYCAGDGDCVSGERCHNASVSVACGTPATTLLLHFCY